MKKTLTILLFIPFMSFGQSTPVKNWSFTSARCLIKDSTMPKNRLIDTTIKHVAIWHCISSENTITMDLPLAGFSKYWDYDSMKVKTTSNPSEYAQYYYMHQKREQDVMLIIYYPRLNKVIEIGIEKGKQIRAKYEAK